MFAACLRVSVRPQEPIGADKKRTGGIGVSVRPEELTQADR